MDAVVHLSINVKFSLLCFIYGKSSDARSLIGSIYKHRFCFFYHFLSFHNSKTDNKSLSLYCQFHEGSISKGSELQVEVAEFLWRNVQVSSN